MSVLAVAHRAGNSLEALRAATEIGADIVEADVQDVRGTLEVHHARTLGRLPWLWEDGRFSHVRERRLHLSEMIDQLPSTTAVMLDLKNESRRGGEIVAAALHQARPELPVIVCGRHWPTMDPFVGLPWARTVLSARTRLEMVRLRRRLRSDAARGVRHYGVCLHTSLLTAARVDALHEQVDLVMTWPVNDERTLRAVVATGVGAVVSDEPAVLRHVVASRSPG